MRRNQGGFVFFRGYEFQKLIEEVYEVTVLVEEFALSTTASER